MTATHVNYDLARETLKAIALDNPDKRADCTYVLDGRPECIVGVALHQWGVPISVLERFCGNEDPCCIAAIYKKMTQYVIFDDASSVDLLQAVQDSQDGGDTWASAVNGSL